MDKVGIENTVFPIAIPFKRFDNLEGKIKEYNIKFRTDDSSLDDLIDFISLDYINRVNIQFSDKINIKVVNTVNKIKNCVYVRVLPEQWPQISELQENEVKFFLDSSMPVSSYSQLAEAMDMGVSDIYIADDLTYNLKDVRYICESNCVQLRTILNRIPMTTLNKGKDVKSTIYRPQDIDYIEQYYDVFEFDCGDPYNWNVFDVLFKAFFINKNWYGNLAEINPDIQFHFPNEQVLNYYTYYKTNCERVCDKRKSNPCKKCEQFMNIGKILREKGIALK